MEQYYVFYNDSGEITSWGMMSEDNLKLTAAANGQNYLFGIGHPITHYVDLETLTIKEREQPLVGYYDSKATNA